MYERLFELRRDVDELKRRLSYELDDLWEGNDVVMGRLAQGFRLATLSLC